MDSILVPLIFIGCVVITLALVIIGILIDEYRFYIWERKQIEGRINRIVEDLRARGLIGIGKEDI